MAWWSDRIRIGATLSIAGWVIVFVVGLSIIVPQGLLPAFGDWPGWIKQVLGWVMIGAAGAATEGLLRVWRGLGISRRSFDVAMVLILLGISCWGLFSKPPLGDTLERGGVFGGVCRGCAGRLAEVEGMS